jgi:hypothetical protein
MQLGFTVSLREISQLPEVREAFLLEQEKLLSHRREFVAALIAETFTAVCSTIEDYEIPLDSGRVVMTLGVHDHALTLDMDEAGATIYTKDLALPASLDATKEEAHLVEGRVMDSVATLLRQWLDEHHPGRGVVTPVSARRRRSTTIDDKGDQVMVVEYGLRHHRIVLQLAELLNRHQIEKQPQSTRRAKSRKSKAKSQKHHRVRA